MSTHSLYCEHRIHVTIAIHIYIYIYSSHEILTNWLINVDNFVQRQSALLKLIEYTNVCKYIFIPLIYIFFNKEGGGGVVELLLCYWGALPL